LVAGGSLVSTGGTDKKSVEAGVSNGTVGDRGIISDMVIKTCEEKYEKDSKNVTSTDTKYFLVEGL